jgi:tyrosyl-tRNA synthetase
LIEQGAVKLNDKAFTDINATIGEAGVLKVGKRKFVRIFV